MGAGYWDESIGKNELFGEGEKEEMEDREREFFWVELWDGEDKGVDEVGEGRREGRKEGRKVKVEGEVWSDVRVVVVMEAERAIEGRIHNRR